MNLPIANNLPRTPRIRAHASAFLVSLWLLGEVASHAADLPAPFVFDLPFAANQATPFWLGHPETPPANFAVLNLPILTPDPDASLLVTVYFQEKDGGFLRIAWRGTQGAQLLSDNFYEGIGMRNQRSLLITPDTLIGDGILTLQCSDLSLGIRRIRMEWLENRASLVSPEVLDAVVVPARGPVQTAHELAGLPHLVEAGAWEGQVVTVPLADVPQRIEQGVEFSVDLDKTPVAARIALKEAGLPLGRHLVVWINQKLAGTVTPSLPDLLDDGFIAGKGGSLDYTGWRDGSFYLPVAFLKAGENTVQFSDEADAPAATADATAAVTEIAPPLAVKDVALQLDYRTAAPVAAVSVSDTTSPTSSESPTP